MCLIRKVLHLLRLEKDVKQWQFVACGEMDTEELIKKCSSITLEEEEEDKVLFEGRIKEKEEMLVAYCLIRKILLNRGIHIEGLRITVRQV